MDKLRSVLAHFSQMSTMIFLVSSIYIHHYQQFECCIDVTYIWGVLLLSFIFAVTYLPHYFDKELSKLQFAVFHFFYFIFINFSTLYTGYYLKWFSFKYKGSVIWMEGMIIFIFLLMLLGAYKKDLKQASIMNDRLRQRNINHEC